MSNLSSKVPSSSSSTSSWGLREFSLAEIKKATKNFDSSLLLRRGWNTEVYKGTYEGYDYKLRTVAIKVFKIKSSWKQKHGEEWETWFKENIEVWLQYNHKHINLVIGYCHEFGEYFVVYEHMVNGSLAQYLCKKITPISFYMSWEQCLQICIDAARGLEYMLNDIRYSNGGKFFHDDVAATNILLDDNWVAKISDLYDEPVTAPNERPSSTLDPESHSMNVTYYQSSNVYAFGVLLVKVLSRKVSFDKEDKNLGIWLKKCILDRTLHDHIIHPEMKAEIPPDCLKTLLDIAGECLDTNSKKRPTITQLVKKLELLMISSPRRPCHCYALREIQNATNNFDSVLGRGGEGTVYKGVTKTNISIAVKRLKPDFSNNEFEREIKMLSDLDHQNLVSLIGYCHESDQKILVYEFMSNGNLSQCLYGGSIPLSWMQRLNVCVGAARGIKYLHTRTNISRKGIIHRDVKPVNILLDENLTAKISDFGLSKLGPQDLEYSEIDTLIKGTRGYFAPEYQKHGKITRRIDVYAFGVVLCEVLCKKKPWDREESFYPTDNEKYGEWANDNIDPNLKGSIAPICLEVFNSMMDKCLDKNPKRRPSMNNVVSMLEYALKWQEAWERQKCGGDFLLPGGEDRIVLYCTLNSESFIKARMLLCRFPKVVEERYFENDLCVMEIKHALGNNADTSMPQLFVNGKHVGDMNEIDELSETGKLGELLGVNPYQFTCDTCQEARACDICKEIYWYVHCNNCGAHNLIWRQWEGRLRTCHECNGDHLICDSATYIRYPRGDSEGRREYRF